MQTKISLNRYIHIAMMIFIFGLVIVNHINFALKDNTLISELDMGYGHRIPGAYNVIQEIISGNAPLKSITVITHTSLSEKYIALAFLLIPKTLTSFKLLHLLPLLLALVGIYLLTKKIQGYKAGLIALIFCATSPGLISFSRQIWIHFHLSIGLIWGIFFLLKSNTGKNLKYLSLALITLLATASLHYAAAFYVILILSALIMTAPEKRLQILSFWILLNSINFFLPPPTSKIMVLVITFANCIYLKKNITTRNLSAMLGVFTLLTTMTTETALMRASGNAKSYFMFSESFYFISFIAVLSFVYFILAFAFLLNIKQNREAKILLASIIIPEMIMLTLQMTGKMPFPRGLDTYIALYLLIFISSACFVESIKKIPHKGILFVAALLFAYHNTYLPKTKINKTATNTLKLFQPNQKSFGKEDLKIFLNSLQPNTAIGVLHAYDPEDIYIGEVSFADSTALWLMSKDNIRVFPIANPAKSSSGQLGLLHCDYFIFEKSKKPHTIVIQTEKILEELPIFARHISIACTDKDIIIYKKKKIAQVIKERIQSLIYQKLTNS